MDSSPFNRSGRTARTPPPIPPAEAPAPAPQPGPRRTEETAAASQDELDAISTPEIQKWMQSIKQCLNEVCTIATEGKLNTEQKLKISTLCRKVGHGTSQMAVQYQSIKLRAFRAYSTLQAVQGEIDLSSQLQDIKHTIKVSSKPAVETSFADMVKKGNNNFMKPLNLSSVAIYPHDKLKSSEETKSLVQKIIKPEEMNLHVRGLRKTRNGGVIISTESKGDIEKLKNSVQLANSGLQVDEQHKRKPRVVVIGVPSSLPEKEFFTCLYHQNLAETIQDCNLDQFLTSIKLSHKSGNKNAETCNYIIEVPALIRKALITKERVFVNWSSCPVRDFTLVTRCYKCQQYGHAAKSCRDSSDTCAHCGDRGHSIKECTKKAEEPKCATCLYFKKPSKHATGFADCPAKILAEKRYINTIDYC